MWWDSGSAIGVDNSNANIGNHNCTRTLVLRGNVEMAIAGCPYCIMCNAGDKAGEAFTSTLGFDIEDHCVNLFSRFHIGKMEIYLFKKIIMTYGITSVKRLFIVYQLAGFVRGNV